MRIFSLFVLSIILVFSTVTGFAQTRTGYVTDRLILTFRQGPGPSYPVLKTLESDTRMTLLEEQSGYYKVRLSSGDTGWVDGQFVTFDTPRSQVIQQMQEEHAALEKQFTELSTAHEQLKTKIAATSENTEDLYQVLEKNKRLEKENQHLAAQVEKLEKNAENLFKTSMIKWFLAGFGVILFGWILGQTISGRNRRQRSLLS